MNLFVFTMKLKDSTLLGNTRTDKLINKLLQAARERREKSAFGVKHGEHKNTKTILDKTSKLNPKRENMMHKEMQRRGSIEKFRMWVILFFTISIVLFLIYYYLKTAILISE